MKADACRQEPLASCTLAFKPYLAPPEVLARPVYASLTAAAEVGFVGAMLARMLLGNAAWSGLMEQREVVAGAQTATVRALLGADCCKYAGKLAAIQQALDSARACQLDSWPEAVTDLLLSMMSPDAAQRPTWQQVRAHEVMRGWGADRLDQLDGWLPL